MEQNGQVILLRAKGGGQQCSDLFRNLKKKNNFEKVGKDKKNFYIDFIPVSHHSP